MLGTTTLQCKIPAGTTTQLNNNNNKNSNNNNNNKNNNMRCIHISSFHRTFFNFANVPSSHNNNKHKMSASKMGAFVVLKTSCAEGFWGHPSKDPMKCKKCAMLCPSLTTKSKVNASRMAAFIGIKNNNSKKKTNNNNNKTKQHQTTNNKHHTITHNNKQQEITTNDNKQQTTPHNNNNNNRVLGFRV